MRKTSFFRPFIWTAVCAVLPAVILSAQNVAPVGPAAPNVPTGGEEVQEIPADSDLAGIEDSIQLDADEDPASELAPAPTSVAPTAPTGNDPVADDSSVLDAQSHQESSEPVSPAVSVPQSILSNPATAKKGSVQQAQVRKQETRHADEISGSSRLLMKLSPAESVLEGVEQVDLRTFLNAPPLRTDLNHLRAGISAYWEASSIRSEVFYWENRLESLKKLSENATGTDLELYNSAAAEAEASLHLARVSLRSNAMRLAFLAGYTREVTAKTLPHAGEYDTRYEEFKNHGEDSSSLTFYHGLVTLYQEQLTAASSAYQSAENLLSLSIRQKKPAVAVLSALDSLNERRKVFFDVLLHFNDAIFNYVLIVSPRRGPEMAQLLVKSSVRKVNPSDAKVPSFPTPPSQTQSVPDSGSLPSGVVVPSQTTVPVQQPVPTSSSGSSPSGETGSLIPAPAVDSGTGQVYAENAAIDLPSATGQASVGESVPVGGESAPLVPGGDLGVPAVETPPPGTDFVPIGGETGVNTNPSLNPTGNEGAAVSPAVHSTGRQVTVGKPFVNSVTHEITSPVSFIRGKKTSVLAKPEIPHKNSITLEYILERASFPNRKSAVHAYWQYVMFQKQSYVLEYQKRLLGFLSQRVLETMKSGSTSDSSLQASLGMLLEQEFLLLRVEQLEVKIQEWRILNRLAKLVSWKTNWPILFPVAVTDFKSESFTLGLDQNESGSAAELRALPLARQLYFARQELEDSFPSILVLADQIAPPSDSLEETALVVRLKTGSQEEVEMILDSLGKARGVSQKYFHLLYDVNATYSSCILASEHSESSPAALARILASTH